TSTTAPSQDSTVTGSCGCGSLVTGSTCSSVTTAVVGSLSRLVPVSGALRSGSGWPSASWVTAKPSTGPAQATTGSVAAASSVLCAGAVGSVSGVVEGAGSAAQATTARERAAAVRACSRREGRALMD